MKRSSHKPWGHALELAESNAACCPDMPTYALMINGGMIGNKDDKTGLHGIYRTFLQENYIGPDNDCTNNSDVHWRHRVRAGES